MTVRRTEQLIEQEAGSGEEGGSLRYQALLATLGNRPCHNRLMRGERSKVTRRALPDEA